MKIKNVYSILEEYKDNEWYSQLELTSEKLKLKELEDEIKEYKPKIAVIGEFSTGKSTLINSFLAKDILPAKFKPTTTFITNIMYSKEEYISVDGEKFELTKERLENIDSVKSEKINIYMNNQTLQKFTIVDTPGTNDPSKFTDEIVFSLIGDVDVVIYAMNVNQALKETEKQFISKLIKKKDIDKFFFALNWSDTIENPRIVKKEVIEKLTTLLNLDKSLLQSHTFLYSAKEVLQSRIEDVENSSYEILLENINNFIKNNRTVLLEEWKNQELEKIVGAILLKMDMLEDQILGKSQKYEDELLKIDQNMKGFEYEIEQELFSLEKEFKIIKNNYKKHVKDSTKYVFNDISDEVNNMDFEQLVGSRYIELRTKKLLEDKVEESSKTFLAEISKVISDFDKNIMDSSKLVKTLTLSSTQKATTAKKTVNMTAIMATGATALSAAPMASSAVAAAGVVSGISAITPMIAAVPVVGPALAIVGGAATIALPIIGTFALAAGKVLFDVGKWGVGKLGDLAKIAEEKVRKIAYIREINNSLSKIESTLLKEIDKININEFKESYINNKFPQKVILENKIKMLNEKKFEVNQLAQQNIVDVEEFKISLLNAIEG